MILGHARQFEYFKQVITRGHLAHAYLFSGPAHVGKLTMAREIAKMLHCENKSAAPCGECDQCRLIDGGRHPHVFLLDREHTLLSKKTELRDIPIEDIWELKRIFSYAPEGNKWRVAIINEAETLSRDAANAFLKLLEEPGSRVLFFLISSSPGLLMPTIRSRAQEVLFSLVSHAALAKFLEGMHVKEEEARDLLFYAAGRPGMLFSMLRDVALYDRQKKLSAYLMKLFFRRDFTEALRASERFSQSEELSRESIASILNIVRRDMLSIINGSSEALGAEIKKIKEIDRISFFLATTNVNKRLALDALFFRALS